MDRLAEVDPGQRKRGVIDIYEIVWPETRSRGQVAPRSGRSQDTLSSFHVLRWMLLGEEGKITVVK